MSDHASRVLVAAALLVCASCGSFSDPEWEWHLQPGLIAVGDGAAPVTVSDTIAGTGSRTVVVQTWGSGSCIRAAGAEVEYGHLVVAIAPIDSVAIGGVCTDDLRSHPRNVVINFDAVGTWTVRVIGRSFDNGAVFETEVVVTDAVNQQ